jgi:hypothetical protein
MILNIDFSLKTLAGPLQLAWFSLDPDHANQGQ